MATVSQKAYQGKPSLEIFGVSGEMAMNECGCMGVWVGGWTKQITHSIPDSEHGIAKTSKLAGGKSITKGFRYC